MIRERRILSTGEPRSAPGEVPEESGGEGRAGSWEQGAGSRERAEGLAERGEQGAGSRELGAWSEQKVGSGGKLSECGHKGALKRARRRF